MLLDVFLHLLDFILNNIETIFSLIFVGISISLNWHNNNEPRATNRNITIIMESSEELIMMGTSYYLALVLARHNLVFSDSSIIKNYEDLSGVIIFGIFLNVIFLITNKKNNHSFSSCEEREVAKKIGYAVMNIVIAASALLIPILLIKSFKY